MDYLLIATLLIYIGVARLIELVNLKVLIAALIVVVVPEAIRLLIIFIIVPDVSPLVQLGLGGAVKLIIQFLVMCITFTLLKQREEEVISWWAVLLVGAVTSVLIVPQVAAFINV